MAISQNIVQAHGDNNMIYFPLYKVYKSTLFRVKDMAITDYSILWVKKPKSFLGSFFPPGNLWAYFRLIFSVCPGA